MTKEEAELVIEILLTADHGCTYCVMELLEKFVERFPDWEELARVESRRINREEHKSVFTDL